MGIRNNTYVEMQNSSHPLFAKIVNHTVISKDKIIQCRSTLTRPTLPKILQYKRSAFNIDPSSRSPSSRNFLSDKRSVD